MLFEESKKNTDIDLDYSSKEIENPFKLETPPRSPSTSFSSSSSTPSKIEDLSPTKMNSTPSPVKKVLVHDENVDVVIGSSGKSVDKMKIKSKTSNFELNVIFGDLFKLPDQTTSFAHCVSRDLKMGKGIAKLFRDKFGRTNELAQANAKIGEAAILKLSNPNRFIYNMVTKEKYSDFPTYDSLQESLIFTRDHALKNKVHHIAMPKIGCGLDKLNWNAVRTLIKNVFLDTDIKISVYHLDAAPAASSATSSCEMATNEFDDNICFDESLAVMKIELTSNDIDKLKPWICEKIAELLGKKKNDRLAKFVINQLEDEEHPDPRKIHTTLAGYLGGKNARIFMGELWKRLVALKVVRDFLFNSIIIICFLLYFFFLIGKRRRRY